MRYVMRSAAAILLILTISMQSAAAADTAPLSPQWRASAYRGLLAELRPRVPANMKFLFVGEPIPCSYGNLRGYGGFVQMRKKSILWFQGSHLYFYLVDANGTLCVLRSINSLSESSTNPRMVEVTVEERQEWVDPPTIDVPVQDGNGGWTMEKQAIGVGYYQTVYYTVVTPLLSPGQTDRLNAYRRAKFATLPVCQ